MAKRLLAALCMVLLGNFVLLDVASAVEPLPMYVIGSARLDGVAVPDGTIIQAYCAGTMAGQTSTFTYNTAAYFAFDIEGDDPESPVRDGCRDAEEVTFIVGGRAAAEPATMQAGTTLGSWAAPFQITTSTATATPTPVATNTASPTPTHTPTPAATDTPTAMNTSTPSATPTTGTIEGAVWADQNGDGQRQPAEKGLAGILVRLSQEIAGTSPGETGRDVLSDETGRYRLTGVVPGSYLVEIIPSAAYRATTEWRILIIVTADTLTTVLPVGLRRLTILYLPVIMTGGATYSILLGRYWIASARCAGWMRSLPARSAIVRASFNTR